MTMTDFLNEFHEILEEAKESLPEDEYNTLVYSDLPQLLRDLKEHIK